MKDAVTAKLASQCEELYAEALRLMQKDSVRPIWDKDWIPIVSTAQSSLYLFTRVTQINFIDTMNLN